MTAERWRPHVIEKDSRRHVCYYDTQGVHCSEKNCEINKPKKGDLNDN